MLNCKTYFLVVFLFYSLGLVNAENIPDLIAKYRADVRRCFYNGDCLAALNCFFIYNIMVNDVQGIAYTATKKNKH